MILETKNEAEEMARFNVREEIKKDTKKNNVGPHLQLFTRKQLLQKIFHFTISC